LLANALSNVKPFDITLSEFGIFGGKSRGVLWLNPQTKYNEFIDLQRKLEEAVPFCTEQRTKGSGNGGFVPHMTLSHFGSAAEAEMVSNELKETWQSLQFQCKEVCILERKGMDGQFQIKYKIGLCGGANGNNVTMYKAPAQTRILGMPKKQPPWLLEAKEAQPISKLKTRRKSTNNYQRRKPTSDNPEEIEMKKIYRSLMKKNDVSLVPLSPSSFNFKPVIHEDWWNSNCKYSKFNRQGIDIITGSFVHPHPKGNVILVTGVCMPIKRPYSYIS
jgi:hypothetical protein